MKPAFAARWLAGVLLAAGSCHAVAVPWDGGVEGLERSLSGAVVGLEGASAPFARPDVDRSSAITTLLAAPLTADRAVRIALLNNPALQIALGRAGSAVTDALSPGDPAKRKARQDITVLSAQAYKAWVQAVAAAQAVGALKEVQAAAQAGAELSRRMAQTGNLSRMAQARTQVALLEATVAVARGAQAAMAAREKLIQVLGLWGAPAAGLTLPAALPALPAQPQDLANAESLAIAARTDLQAEQLQWQIRRTSGVPGTVDERWEAMGDAARVQALAVQVRSQAREAYFSYRSAWDIAHHMDTALLPLRTFIHDELVLRYNGMLTSLFDVLADRQAQAMSAQAATQARRDFWLAHADLQAVLAGAPLEALAGNPGPGTGGEPAGSTAATAAH